MKIYLPNDLHCYLYKVLKIMYLALNCLNAMLKEHISEELECFSNKPLQDIDNTAVLQFGDKEITRVIKLKHINSQTHCNEVCTGRTLQQANLPGRHNHSSSFQSGLRITKSKKENFLYSCNTKRLFVAKDIACVFRAQNGKNAKQEVSKSLLNNEPANFIQECYPATKFTSNKLSCDKSHSSAEATASSTAGKLLTLPAKLHQQL